MTEDHVADMPLPRLDAMGGLTVNQLGKLLVVLHPADGKRLSSFSRQYTLSAHHCNHSSSERSERFVRFESNVRSERVRYFSERETNVQALKRLTNLIAVK